MEFHAIDLYRTAEWHAAHYLEHIAPEVAFINRCMSEPGLMDIALKEAGEMIDSRRSDKGHSGRIITDDAVARLLGQPCISGILDRSGYSGYVDRETARHNCVVSLLSYCIGAICSGEKPEDIVPFIERFSIDDEWTGFILAAKFSDELVDSILLSDCYTQASLSTFLDRRRITISGLEEYYASLSLDKKLEEIDSPAFEYEFYTLYDRYGFLGALVERNSAFKAFAGYLATLTLPHFQYEALAAISNPDNLLTIAKECCSFSIEDDRKAVLSAIILRLWFQNMVRVKAENSIGLTSKDEHLIELRKAIVDDFDNNLKYRIDCGIKDFTAMLGEYFMSEWLFTKTEPAPERENEESKAITELLHLCRESFVAIAGIKGFNTEITDLNYLSSYAEILSDSDLTKEKTLLYRAIIKGLHHDRNFLIGNISRQLLLRLDVLAGYLTKYLQGDTMKFFNENFIDFKVRFTGLRATPYDKLYERSSYESQFLMLSLYMSCLGNEKTRNDDFLTIARYAMSQAYAACNDFYFESCYLRILQLGELIADQHIQPVKSTYNRMCMQTVPYYPALLAVFSQSARDIDPDSKAQIERGHKEEWPVIEDRLLSRGQKQTADYYRQLFTHISSLQTH